MNWLFKIWSVPGLIWSVPGLAKKAADICISVLESEATRYLNLKKELERIRCVSDKINSRLIDADKRRYIEDESVIKWLRDLKSVSFDTDDLLDLYQTAIDVHKYNPNLTPSRKRKWSTMVLPSIDPLWDPFQRRRFTSDIDKIDKKLNDIEKSRKDLTLRGRDEEMSDQPQTGPRHDWASIIGRENDKNEVVDLLITAQTSTIAVVPIHGAAGIGKTTLARMVYDDLRLNCFNIKAWVCLPEKCNVSTALKKIFEEMTDQRSDYGDFRTLQDKLWEYLDKREDNKFLLVIDNFWEIGLDYWEQLRDPLLAGGSGSKVLITTRYRNTYQSMRDVIDRPILKGLDEEDCWQLIQSRALPQGIINHNHNYEKLVSIGKDIAKKCHGSPMVAKALGAVLNGRSDDKWSDMLREMRVLKDDINGYVLASLNISYHHLKYHLKQCFAYCSIYPNSYVFERDQAIRYWMAEGLIEPDGTHQLEAVGTEYFDELISRSFFEKITIGTEDQNANCFSPKVEKYRMTSLMLDLAMEVSRYEFRRFESGKRLPEGKYRNSDQVRYASFLQRNDTITVELECLEPYSNLRTLKLCHELNKGVFLLNSAAPASFFRKFMHLRVLDMSNSDLEEVPDSIGELIHLRFLGLSNTKITTLPEKICNLFNLQTLELKGCLKLEGLPEGLRRLINLRHLDLHLDWVLITDSTKVALPQGFDELKYLQTLSRFNMTSAEGQYHNIIELKNLNLIRGDLCILNLEKVPTGHAKNANLEQKQFIENLMLRWDSSAPIDRKLQQQSEEVIKYLQPHNILRCLWVVNYPGNNFPHWMGDASFSKLETIRIYNCNNVSFLPILGQLEGLKNLQIDNLHVNTMSMPGGFPSLEHLQLLKLSSLRSLYLGNEIPTLKKIDVSDCPKLVELFIHRHLHHKFEKKNFPKMRIICVPD